MAGRSHLELVREKRTDISQFLIHWTNHNNFFNYGGILDSGVFLPGHGERWIGPYGQDGRKPTIRGPYKAVCFSETPIGNYLQSFDLIPQHKNLCYGVALPKRLLYSYGARTVLYGDEDFFGRLDKEDKFLFSHFKYRAPDWTHEREWRTRHNNDINEKLGVEYRRNRNIVPFYLPKLDEGQDSQEQLPDDPQFVLIVDKDNEKSEIAAFVETKFEKPEARVRSMYCGMIDYRKKYRCALQRARIVSLEEIRKRRDQENLWRLEDFLP